MQIRLLPMLIASVLLGGANGTFGQSGPSMSRLTLQGPAEQAGKVVKDALGRPCLDIEAAAVPHAVDPKILDHVVSLKNNCPRLIKTKVCYFGSQTCNEVALQGYKRVDTILGSMRGITAFRYSIEQK
ncbi:hypothetical protein GA0061098_1004208 [Bradyrhizobium shewense]|uniref:Uncharacterized protein n=1 Tax=Bradyrhizobium shewense TaxID=1761772 RepID=A0A1C3VGX7_9BRAD|nr:hypothetical protein GA0061098_1004208 [Bradyrhizobium shewense]